MNDVEPLGRNYIVVRFDGSLTFINVAYFEDILLEAHADFPKAKKILVIGGGMTGISAAIDAAKIGYEVTIVEKEASLGGNAAKWRQQLPGAYPYEGLISPAIETKINDLQNYANITTRTETDRWRRHRSTSLRIDKSRSKATKSWSRSVI